MTPSERTALFALPAIVVAAGGLAWAGSLRGVGLGGTGPPVFAVVVALVFVIQWLAFLPAWRRETEAFYDLVGSATFLVAIAVTLTASAPPAGRWAGRRRRSTPPGR